MNKKFSSFLLVPFFVLLLNSCNPNIGSLLSPFQQEPKQKVSAEINPFQTSLATPEQLLMRQQELEKIKNKNVYAGPLSIKIDTGRMEQKNKNAGRIIDVSTLLATQKPSFTIQAIPDGPVVFQERFTKGKGNLEITRAFRVAETSQRYTVHVQKISQKHDNNIQLNINGTDWILEKDFPRHALEIQRDSLLLNTNNSLKIRLKGDTGAAVVVTIVEGGQAGTILKRQKKLGLPGETHETHLRQNDINIFDPNDPESLGGLTPYEGIETITAGSKTYEFSELALNGISVQIENARILMVFKDEQSKQNFLAAYNAEIEQEEYGASLVKFDLSQAPVENLNELIRHANTLMMADIKDVSVSSLNGLKTFALLLDVHKNHRDKFLFADPNFRLEANQSTPPLPTSLPDWDDGAKSWWLTDTNVLQAWDYSLGSGVRIAWLDLGTNHLNFGHSELLRKTDGNFLVNENMSLLADAVGAFDNHSLYCQMIGFAERNNTYIHSSGALAPLRTAGVAPNATVIPYNVLTHNDKVKASLKAAYKARVDVIGSSYGCLHCRDDVFRFFESISFEGNVLDQTIDWIVNGLHIPYVQAAGNSGTKLEQGKYGIHVSKNIPSGDTNNLIMAGAVVAPANRANNVYDNNSLTNYEVTRYSNFGENVIYAPGEGIWVSERTNPLNLTYMNGTSSAAPFVTGIVALMLSRNPDLLPAQILTILKNSSKTGLIDLKMPSLFSSGVGTIEFKNPSYALHPGQLKLIDVEEAVKQAITLRGSAPKSVEEHFGIIKEENGKKLLLNRFSDGTATPGEQSKAINWQTVSDNVWSELSDGAVVKIKSWSDISVGKIITYPPASFPFGSNVPIMGFRTPLYIGPNALEIQDVEKICDLKSGSAYYLQCPGPLAISPIINNLEIHQDSLHNIQNLNKDRGVEIDVDGNNLWVNNILSGSRVKVNFHEVYSTGIPVSPANTYAFDVYPQSIKNDGKQIKIKISNFEFFSKNIKSGHYRISLELLTGNTPLRGFVSSSGIDNFIVTDFGSGFSISSIQQPPTNATPENFGVKAFVEPNNTTPISVRAGDKVGVFVSRSLYSDIKIEIQGGNAVYTFINDNFLTFTIPAFLTIGNLDVLFKSNEGEFKIERLLNYTSPYPEVVKFSKPTIFANGGDVVDAYITVKDPNGQPAPDGTPYYVQLMPTQLGLYPDLTMIHPETGQQYGGRWTTVEQVLPVKNGKIHIQAKLNAPISPYEYTYDFNNNLPNVFTWPHANAPSFQVQVCNPAYNSSKPGYGYYCGQQLFPQTGNTLDGRLYAVHAYSFDPQIHHVTGGSIKRTITIRNIKDILGNPVPVGTVLHFNQTYYGNVSNPNGNDIYWGVAVTTPGEIDIVYEPFQRISCGLVGVEEYIYMTSVQGAASSSQHWLVGNPIYFRYVAC